jgi:hypothetical protein
MTDFLAPALSKDQLFQNPFFKPLFQIWGKLKVYVNMMAFIVLY